MNIQPIPISLLTFVLTAFPAYAADANLKAHSEGQHMAHHDAQDAEIPTSPGQEAFGANQEIVRILDADSNTDWRKVNIENLRQHLIDMDEVVLHSEAKSMVIPHSGMLNQMPQWTAQADETATGVRLTVKAKDPKDTRTIAKIRGLGFAGLLAQGSHHQIHHLAMAKGEWNHHH